MILSGIRFGADIAAAAAGHQVDPVLLAAVAAQESGGPDSTSGANVVGADGHGRGVFQIDDRSWAFARTPAVMNPAKNADMAASILHDNLQRYGGNVTQALAAYNTGSPNATGTLTKWGDGRTLGYAASVLRHYDDIVRQQQPQALADNRETAAGVNALATLGAAQPVPAPAAASAQGSSAASAAALAQNAMPQLPEPLSPPAPVPAGSQAQAAATVGAQADDDEANLVDGGDVFDTAADTDG